MKTMRIDVEIRIQGQNVAISLLVYFTITFLLEKRPSCFRYYQG